jgi:Transposase DDE domain group 1
MGDSEKAPLRLQFNPKIRLEFHGATITSDAGLLAFRELDDALGLTCIASDYLPENRTGRNIRHHLVPLLTQSIYSRLAGYHDTNDAERHCQDPAMRVIVGWQDSERKGASTSEMGRLETELMTQESNLQGLARMNTQWVERAMAHTPLRRVILDMDSSESPVHGRQEGAAYNGHFECVCYHPLFCFNQFGDCEGAKLRPGNVHSADDWQGVLEPIIDRYLQMALRLLFRADAAFAKPEIYAYLEAKNIGYAIRLPANEVLQREIAHLLVRPTEWPSKGSMVSYHDFVYRAQSWNVSRRVVSKTKSLP